MSRAVIRLPLLCSLVLALFGCDRAAPRTSPPKPEPAAAGPSSELRQARETLDSIPAAKLRRDGETIVVVDLREVPENRLQEAVAATALLPQVEEISLSGPEVDDALVRPLTRLQSLRRFRLRETNVGDATLGRLAERAQLELLDLTDAGQITAAGIGWLAHMEKLRNLRLSGAAVNDESVEALADLDQLAALALQETNVSDAGIEAIAGLKKLKELSLYGTAVTDAALPTLARLPALEKLRLRATAVTGAAAEPLAETPIVDLELAETEFSNAGMPAVAAMPKLEKLNLWLTQIDDAGLAELRGKTQLVLLNLDNVRGITNESLEVIGGLQRLELLHLGGTGVTEQELPKLYGLDRLETLFLTRLGISDQAAAKLRQELPSLERLEY